MIQTWMALITILLLKALKAMAKFGWHLLNFVAFIRLQLFVKINFQVWLDNSFINAVGIKEISKQWDLFENSLFFMSVCIITIFFG